MINPIKQKPPKRRTLSLEAARPLLFQDTEFYSAFRRKIIPMLKTYPSIRIWHVGCSAQTDLFSLIILLHEECLDTKCRIYVTEKNGRLLKHMENGSIPVSILRSSVRNFQKVGGQGDLLSYFTRNGSQAFLTDSLRERLSFFHHNLTMDQSFNEFQVIVFRDGMQHYVRSSHEHIQQLLLESLCRFGVLCLAGGEIMNGTKWINHYRPLDMENQLYKRVA